MNTKNIFRTLFMAVLLLVGVDSAKATETQVWKGSEDSKFTIPAANFANVTIKEDYLVKIYYTNSNYDYWEIQFTNNSGNLALKNNDGIQTWGEPWVYQVWQNSLFQDGYITLICSATTAELLKSSGINITPTGLTVISVAIDEGSIDSNPSDSPITYTLTYMVDGRQYGDTETHEAGDNITPRAEPPAKQGYTFSGWSGLPADGKMPANNVTVTGYYTRDYVTAPIDSYGYATFSSSSPLDFSSVRDVKAYIAQQVSDDMVELVQIMGTCAAGTGLVLIGENNNNPGYQVPVATTDGVDYSNQNLLKAVLSSTYINSSTDFVLTYQNGGVVFAATGNREATIPAGHAYLEWSQGSNARALKVVVAGETTGVNAVENALTGNEVIYNLRGQRVVNPGKGVYIINGKKVVLK